MTATTLRERWRKGLLVAGLLPLLLAVALVVKVALMVGYDRGGRAAYAEESFREARSSFAANAVLNWFEPWVAPYDEGLARYRLEDHDGAVRLYRLALVEAPATEQCRVRVNLALALEARGDRASAEGRPDDARVEWTEALSALDAGRCLDLSEASRPADVAAAQIVDDRVRGKMAEETTDPPLEPEPPREEPEPPPPTSEQLAQLEEQNQKAQERRREEQERREDRQRPTPPEGEPPVYEW
ncbi:hypothetical protein NOK12_12240 [Nocardioides sp. OK12]|uniref:hypothetical protein n=1 Tax=Nocardioides sp. OK12 TaxID=2758661 RepID=UPI0021C4A79C|nr:hypothetical protein [Nocardioides sp. OK12]GHJ58706.1 hypothetical protein NOK12_12240 [Nocardioides sp. OK12]